MTINLKKYNENANKLNDSSTIFSLLSQGYVLQSILIFLHSNLLKW